MNSSNKTKILLAEDDPNLGIVLKEYLELKGHDVTLCTDGEACSIAYFESTDFDLLILDVMMPKKDGFTLAAEIRKTDKRIPIIFLTAKSMNKDILKGFKVGGDDYMTKPFSMEELQMRMNAVLRRVQIQTGTNGTYKIGEYEFEYDQQLLKYKEDQNKLTTKEAELLKLLCSNLNQLVTRETALNKIWGEDDYFKGRSMDVFIAKIRKYLNNDPAVELMNVHGTGFKLMVKS
ncbi:MAG: response regulator transcription factor [Bacteroidetes bacterium]|nr:response regulator transcription factor [Bacteroidota bacterium]